MHPDTWRFSKSIPSLPALRLLWIAFVERYIATDAPADLDQIEAELDAEPPETLDAIILIVATVVTLAWMAFLVALLIT